MFEYLQPRDGPVIDGLEEHEVILAKDQPEYVPLRVLIGRTLQRPMMSRFTLTPEQREAIANGADLFINQLTFDDKFHPISIAVGDTANPDFFREKFALPGSAAGERLDEAQKLFERERDALRRRIAGELGTA